MEKGVEYMTKKKESSGWLMSIVIGLIVAVLLIIVVYPNFLGKKNQGEPEENSQQSIIYETDVNMYHTF